MQRYFPGARYLYWILNVAGLGGITGLTIYLNGAVPWLNDILLSVLFGLALFLGWMILTTKLASIMARRNMRKVLDILDTECDPEKYVSTLRRMAQIPNKDVFKNYLSLKICGGLVHMGQYGEAAEILERLANAPPESMRGLNRFDYLRNGIAIHTHRGETEQAEEKINLLTELNDTVRDEKYKRNIANQIALSSAVLRMGRGDYSGAEETLKGAFENASNDLQRVGAQYQLGEVYLKARKKDKAREAFQYVLDHGNKLQLAEEAREKLKSL